METPRKQRAKTREASAAGRILLVEDHEAVAALRCTVLRQQGYSVVLTADGLEACRLIENEAFDLVVTDARLPAGSGWDVARAAKKNHLPVILSTGWPLPSRAMGMDIDVDYVLNKPSSLAHFLALVQQALRKTETSEPRS
jgi:DNA-binding response OmpR family regulator